MGGTRYLSKLVDSFTMHKEEVYVPSKTVAGWLIIFLEFLVFYQNKFDKLIISVSSLNITGFS